PAPEASEDEGHGRRRRRGRRGGRRMREDGRPTDAYAWVRPWVPYGDDPFVWHDPAQDIPVIVEAPAPAPAIAAAAAEPPPALVEAAEEAPAPAAAVSSPEAAPEVMEDVWVELPAVEEKPKKPRR